MKKRIHYGVVLVVVDNVHMVEHTVAHMVAVVVRIVGTVDRKILVDNTFYVQKYAINAK